MSENGEKCRPQMSCFVKTLTTERYSVYCHRGEKKLEQYSHLKTWNHKKNVIEKRTQPIKSII